MHALVLHGMVGSMGGFRAFGDNAALESSFVLKPTNVLNCRRRRQIRLGGLAPIECGTIMTKQVALAAQPRLSPEG